MGWTETYFDQLHEMSMFTSRLFSIHVPPERFISLHEVLTLEFILKHHFLTNRLLIVLFQVVYKNKLLQYKISGELKWRGLKTKWKWRCKCRVSSTGQAVESDWFLGRASTLADALRRLNW